MRDPLARMIGETPASQPELRAMAAAAWHAKGVIVIWPDEIRNPIDRLAVESTAERLYGKRENEQCRGDRNGA
jgi:hypothetical protein